ncbi:MAG: hypothetical protein IKO55_11440 [Kiritimatiellae bacterium]|nr:hypothetical protein [Kiritimatiellia bacterium]
MPPIETIVRPVQNRISIEIPEQYWSYSFKVVLVPLAPIDNSGEGTGKEELDPRVRSMRGVIKMSPGVRIGDELHDGILDRYEALQ